MPWIIYRELTIQEQITSPPVAAGPMVPTPGLPTPKVTHDYDTDHGIDDIQVETTTDDGGITTTETHMRVPPGLFYVLTKSSAHIRPEFMVIGLKKTEDGTLNPFGKSSKTYPNDFRNIRFPSGDSDRFLEN